MGEYKDKTGQSRVGSFLKNVAPDLLNIAGDLSGISALGNLGDMIKGSPTLSPDNKIEALSLLNLDVQDRQRATDMQIAALKQTDLFSKRFIYYLAGFIMLMTAVFMVLLFIVEIPEGNSAIVYMAIGMFFGFAAGVATFFFGSSQGSSDKGAEINKLIKKFSK